MTAAFLLHKTVHDKFRVNCIARHCHKSTLEQFLAKKAIVFSESLISSYYLQGQHLLQQNNYNIYKLFRSFHELLAVIFHYECLHISFWLPQTSNEFVFCQTCRYCLSADERIMSYVTFVTVQILLKLKQCATYVPEESVHYTTQILMMSPLWSFQEINE